MQAWKSCVRASACPGLCSFAVLCSEGLESGVSQTLVTEITQPVKDLLRIITYQIFHMTRLLSFHQFFWGGCTFYWDEQTISKTLTDIWISEWMKQLTWVFVRSQAWLDACVETNGFIYPLNSAHVVFDILSHNRYRTGMLVLNVLDMCLFDSCMVCLSYRANYDWAMLRSQRRLDGRVWFK